MTNLPLSCRQQLYYMVFFAAALLLCSCSLLPSADLPPPELFSLEAAPPPVREQAEVPVSAPTLIVGVPRAAAGFDTRRIIYVRQEFRLEYYQQSQWVDTPANMLTPLLVTALEQSGRFRAVVQAPTGTDGQMRLDVEIVRLQHEFLAVPSRVRFTLRAHLVDTATRRMIAWKECDVVVPSPSDDAYGGVIAANAAVRTVIGELVAFCAMESREREKPQP
jgi:cholesterol transport system auxiliary component